MSYSAVYFCGWNVFISHPHPCTGTLGNRCEVWYGGPSIAVLSRCFTWPLPFDSTIEPLLRNVSAPWWKVLRYMCIVVLNRLKDISHSIFNKIQKSGILETPSMSWDVNITLLSKFIIYLLTNIDTRSFWNKYICPLSYLNRINGIKRLELYSSIYRKCIKGQGLSTLCTQALSSLTSFPSVEIIVKINTKTDVCKK